MLLVSLLMLTSLTDVASHNVPVASVVAVDSAGADVIAAIGVP